MTASVYGKLIDLVAYDHVVIAGMRIERPITVPTHAWEDFWRIAQDGTVEENTRQDLFDEGRDEGYIKGREIGHDVGYAEGNNEGFEKGLKEGYDEGFNAGYAKGLAVYEP